MNAVPGAAPGTARHRRVVPNALLMLKGHSAMSGGCDDLRRETF